MNLEYQKRLASRIFKVGLGRIWLDPEKSEDIANALTAEDIRNLERQGIIKVLPKKGNSKGRFRLRMKQKLKGRRKGHGSRKGKASAREDPKREWIRKIRSQRRYLRSIKESLKESAYRDLYRKSSGGFFRSIAHMKMYIEKNELTRGSE